MKDDFVIALNGLKAGRTAFEWHADGEFFGDFENSEVLDADLDVEVSVEKSVRYIGVDCLIQGSVTVSCDRCLGDLSLPMDTCAKLSVKLGETQESSEEGEREIIMLPEEDTVLDMSQIVYDYVCTALPVQRVHPEGQCDPEVVKYLSSSEDDVREETEPVETPFAALKDLLEKR